MALFFLDLSIAIGANFLLIVGFLLTVIFRNKLHQKWGPFWFGFTFCAISSLGNLISAFTTANFTRITIMQIAVFATLSIFFILFLKKKTHTS